ncbi:MAG TPA: murein biosynthesis integral membrane protein MurJ [Ktedonobacterales bacterium]|jgi:putative peptidoglycan lipid II flippase
MPDTVYSAPLDSEDVTEDSREVEVFTDPRLAIASVTTEPLPRVQAASERSVNVRILAALISLSGASIAARAFGVLNQVVISDHFGAGVSMDAYFAVLALPTLLTNLIVSALQASVIPTYVRLTRANQEREASDVLSTLFNLVILFLAGVLALMLFFPRFAISLFAPGVSSATVDVGVTLAPLIFPTLLLNIFVGFITSVFNASRRFAFPAFTAMLMPLGILVATILLSSQFGVSALAIGQLVGTGLQFLIMLALVRKARFSYRPVLRLGSPHVRVALGQLWPMLFGATIGQANPVIDQIVASTLGSGAISALNYALKVISIPVTMIFMATSQAVLPYFASQAAARDFRSLKKTLNLFLWAIGIITLVVTVGFIVFAQPIITLLFRHGAFTDESAQKTSATLIGLAVGLLPMAWGFMIPRVFNSLHRNDVLLRIAIFTLITNVVLDIALARFLGLPGIGLATSLAYLLTTLIQIAVLRLLIGPLGLLRVPPQLLEWLSPQRWMGRTRFSRAGPPRRFNSWRILRNGALVLGGFLVVAVIASRDAIQGVRVSLGMALAFFFLPSPYLLLLTWAGMGAFYDVYIGGHSIGFVLALASLPAFALAFWRQWRGLARQTWAIWAYVFFLVWLLPGARLSPLGLSEFSVTVWGLFDYLALMVFTVAMLTTRDRFERFLSVLLTTSTLLCFVGLAEYALRFGGSQQEGVIWIYRVGGVFGWYNSFGFYLDLLLPLCLYRLLTAPRGRRRFWGGILALHVLALGLTFSRAGMISAIFMVITTAMLLNGRLRWWMLRGVSGVIALIAVLLLIPGLGLNQRLLGDHLLTLDDRTDAWGLLLSQLDLRNPFGHSYYASWALLLRDHPGGVAAPHSLYLQTLFDMGIPGLAFLLATFALLLWGGTRKALRSQGEARIAAAVATGGIFGAVVNSLVGNEFLDFALGLHFWFLAALPYLPLFAAGSGRRKGAAAPAPAQQKDSLSVQFVTWQFFPFVGGAEVRALREARALQARGHRVHVLTLRLKRSLAATEEIEGVPVRRIGGLFVRGRLRLRFGAQWIAEWLLFRELLRARNSYQVVHLRQLSVLARPAALAALFTGKPLFIRLASTSPSDDPLVRMSAKTTLCLGPLNPSLPFLQVEEHSWAGSDLQTLRRSQWLAGLTLWLLKYCGAVFIAISTRIQTTLQKIGFRPKRIALLPNGIDLDQYKEYALGVSMRLAAQPTEAPKVVCAARFNYVKGLDVLIHAWREVHAALPEARLLLVGGGTLRYQLEALAAALDLSQSIEFIDLTQDVRPFLAEADLFVLPSRFEGMPNALLEAMACGLPCVATRVSGSEDAIVDGESGLLVPPGDPESLAKALLALLMDRNRARACGAAAYMRVQQHFQDDTLIDQLLGLYHEAVGGKHLLPTPVGLQEAAPFSGAPTETPSLARPMSARAKSEE